MSEGEFTKRIDQNIRYMNATGSYGEGKEAAINYFFKLVAEATQEWRETDNYDKAKDELGKIMEQGRSPTRDETIRILQYKLRRKNAWAHRWLGGDRTE